MPTLLSTERVAFVLTITNAAGQPAQVDGVPVYASSDETIIRVLPAADGMSGWVEAVAPNANTATVSVTADADLGAGVVPIAGASDPADPFTVTVDPASRASNFTMAFGLPEPKA